jgi:hypothetical protein
VTSQFLYLAAAAGLLLAAFAGATYVARRKRAAKKAVVAAPATATDTLSDRLERLEDAVAEMSDLMKDTRSDVAWLAGERMIDQAISLARQGESGHEISRKTGISADELVGMQAFRKH